MFDPSAGDHTVDTMTMTVSQPDVSIGLIVCEILDVCLCRFFEDRKKYTPHPSSKCAGSEVRTRKIKKIFTEYCGRAPLTLIHKP